MTFTFNHTNLNVCDIARSVRFYKEALGLEVVREKTSSDGSFTLTFERYEQLPKEKEAAVIEDAKALREDDKE